MLKRYPVGRVVGGLTSIGVAAILGATAVFAQTTGYDPGWFSIAGGGSSTGGAYDMNGVIGQPDAGSMAGGAYTLSGGFLQPTEFRAHLPITLR